MNADDIAIEEFRAMRTEINTRTQLAYGLLALELSAVGVGFSFFQEFPEVALGLGVASIFLWLVWMDHVAQVLKIAAYIALRLAPKLRSIDPDALGWERFLRVIDAGGNQAARALFGSEKRKLPRAHSFGITRAMTALFGGAPLLLFVAYGIGVARMSGWNGLRIGALVGLMLLWLIVANQYRRVGSLAGHFDEAIKNAP